MNRVEESRGLVVGTAAVLAGSVAALAGALAVRILMARFLDPGRLGVLSFGIALVSSLGGIASLGFYSASTRRIAEQLELGAREVAVMAARTAAAVTGASGLLCTAAVAVGGPGLARLAGAARLATLLPILAPVVAGLAIGTAVWGISQGFGDVRGRAMVRDTGGSLFRLLGVGAACLLGGGLVGITVGFAAGSVVGELAFLTYGVRMGWFRGSRAWDRQLLRELPPYTGLNFLGQFKGWADVLLLGVFSSPAEVGLYAVARGLSQLGNMIWLSANHRFLPIASARAAVGNKEALAQVCAQTRRLLLALLWPVIAVCLLWPRTLIGLLFGAAYTGGAPALQLLTAGYVIQVLLGYNQPTLVALDRPTALFRLGLSGTIATVLGLVLLAPLFGATGAAAAVLVGTVVQAVPAWWLVRRSIGRPEPLGRFAAWVILLVAPTLAVAGVLHWVGVGSWLSVLATGLVAAPAAARVVGVEVLQSVTRPRRADPPPQ